MNKRENRRTFLKTSAMAGCGFWVAAAAARAESNSPNEKLNIGILGVNRWRLPKFSETSEVFCTIF